MKKILFLILLFSCTFSVFSRPFKIISNNNKVGQVSDTIHSGDFYIGLNDYGGGAITLVSLPAMGTSPFILNTMGTESSQYGRMGQSDIRDSGHWGKYNPTQAGFNEGTGTECQITASPGKRVVQPRGCALWYGDGAYDFIRWENIGMIRMMR